MYVNWYEYLFIKFRISKCLIVNIVNKHEYTLQFNSAVDKTILYNKYSDRYMQTIFVLHDYSNRDPTLFRIRQHLNYNKYKQTIQVTTLLELAHISFMP